LNDSLNHILPDDLLARYLAHTATAAERQQVHDWVQVADQNRQHLAAFEQLWHEANGLPQRPSVDVEAAWKNVQRQIQTGQTGGIIKPLHQNAPKRMWWQVAAAVAFMLGMSWWGYRLVVSPPTEILTLQTQGFQLEKTLPDGTLVYLNANTQLSYPADFEDSTRKVLLKGEAFFNVKPDASKPFVIEANGSTVRVLGTSFNVKAYDANVRVVVETGKVAFGTPRQKVLLTPGEAAQLEVLTDTILKTKEVKKNELAYRTKIFLFEETSLQEVVKALSEAYQTEIILKNKRIRGCKLTATFEHQNLDTILANLTETLELSITKDGEKIILDGKGCD
jgi:transmembrane sensor